MLIQVLEEYKNRMEYRILNNFCNCKIVSMNALKKGSLILPGILLKKMKKEELGVLNSWIKNKENQLLLLPTWNEMNLKEYFNTSVDIKVKRTAGYFNEISADYEIETVAKDKLFFENRKFFGVNYRSNLSSGLITVVTLPLLDYKMIDFEDEFKKYFYGLIQKVDCVEEKFEGTNVEIDIDNVHIFLIILLAADVQLQKDMALNIFKYFGAKFEEKLLVRKYKELITGEFINDEKLMDKGIKIVVEKNLRAFISVVKERRKNEDGWR